MENNGTPEASLSDLLAGNRRFTGETPQRPRATADRRQALAGGQTPSTIVFSCSDSRVPAEIVFDQGLGDLFVVRTAGHVVDDAVLASVEFGATALNIPLLLVLGHTDCGAVKAALATRRTSERPPGHLGLVADQIDPCIPDGDTDACAVDDVVRAHAAATLDLLRDRSPVLADAMSSGRLLTAVAVYDLASGEVETLHHPHP